MVSESQSVELQPQAMFEFFRPKPDGEIDPAGEAGWFLQRERERRGETLEEVGWACNIHPHHLEAIELGDLTRLPPRAEALEMIGAYADYLRFDPQPLVKHYAQFLPRQAPVPPRQAPALKMPRPLGSAKIIAMPYVRMAREHLSSTSAGGIVAAVAGAVLVFGLASWLLTPSSDRTVAANTTGSIVAASPTPAPAAPPTQQAAVETSGQVSSVASISKVEQKPMDETQSISSADQAMAQVDSLTALIERETKGQITADTKSQAKLPEPATVAAVAPAPAAAAAPAPAPGTGKVYGSENADARVVLTAVEPVWIRLEDNGTVVLSQTLQAGDSIRVPNRPGMMVIARDGGLVNVTVDGVSKGSLGRKGEIVVGRAVDAKSLTSG
ncbi:MAG: helix-turn-helix domain-containing protein [Hyphomicrobiales bacterium]